MYADGTIYANALVTGTITSDSGKIGALSVKSLSIGDNAVTVPVAQTLSTVVNSVSVVEVGKVTLTIDTTGLSGKTITILAGWTGQMAFSASGGNPVAYLYINGGNVQSVVTNDSSDWFFSLSGTANIVGTGGSVSVDVQAFWAAQTGGVGAALGVVLYGRRRQSDEILYLLSR